MKYWGVTDRGKIRKNNQDSFVISENEAGNILAVVCDGIGGAKNGDWASNLVSERLAESFQENAAFSNKQSVKKWFTNNIGLTNEIIYQESLLSADCKGMGTTIVALMVYKNGIMVVNCGDSRCYCYYRGALQQLTRDHTVIDDLVKQGALSQEQAQFHPKRHVLSRAVGAEKEVKLDFYQVDDDCDAILLCSDGLSGLLSTKEIENVLKKKESSEIKAKELLEIANNNGGYDNITVVLLER